MTDYVRPCKPKKISDNFAAHVARGSKKAWHGTDYVCPEGTQIWASAEGTVVTADSVDDSSRGKNITIKHPDGQQTAYFHLSRVDVKVGQKVTRGQNIGLSGNTGASTGAHLHFVILNKDGKPVDAEPILEASLIRINAAKPATSGERPVIKRGDDGADAAYLQKKLGVDTQGSDGVFGPKTEAAVIAFQKKHKLPETGIVDAATWKAIG